MKVALRPARRVDRAWIDECLDDALRAAGQSGEISHEELRRDVNTVVRVVVVEHELAGVVLYRLSDDSDAACFEFVATREGFARRGIGMMAAAMTEREMRRRGAAFAYAPAAEKHGIGMYFWIRLGYAPLLRDAWPCDRDGIAWLGRKLSG